ncbi:hypothetical protein GALL_298150 [mine drainage metagenome]|uniref:Uncharacterized protein n=1 Tax=mine drainage metagenome TaxID=410659 RepID=A0A1J5R8D1_9ZZZZ
MGLGLQLLETSAICRPPVVARALGSPSGEQGGAGAVNQGLGFARDGIQEGRAPGVAVALGQFVLVFAHQ